MERSLNISYTSARSSSPHAQSGRSSLCPSDKKLGALPAQRRTSRHITPLLPSAAALGIQSTLPQRILHHLLQTGLGPLLRLGGLGAAELDVAEGEQIAQVGALLGRCVRGQNLCLGLLAEDLALGVEGAEEGGVCGLGGGAEGAVEIAQGARGGEGGVGDAGASELEEALE